MDKLFSLSECISMGLEAIQRSQLISRIQWQHLKSDLAVQSHSYISSLQYFLNLPLMELRIETSAE